MPAVSVGPVATVKKPDDLWQRHLIRIQVLRPGGRLILLEHGRSSWSFINNLLDSDAQRHYASWGCWWNRDMLAVLAEVCLRHVVPR